LVIHITLETAPSEMQCDETISHLVTAGRSYFCTLRNACVTAGKIYHGCFEMLSWPHRTSANIISTCFRLLETCRNCLYFIEENIRPGAQGLAFEVRVYRTPATDIPCAGVLRLGKFPDNRRSMCWIVHIFILFRRNVFTKTID